mmetsp:Transcript_24855/g.80391  ORF Transcript_24855/g.80391 Transcript_24855/m.80391 type:complete len:290 (+) Transcript_24855:1595-2464(+)
MFLQVCRRKEARVSAAASQSKVGSLPASGGEFVDAGSDVRRVAVIRTVDALEDFELLLVDRPGLLTTAGGAQHLGVGRPGVSDLNDVMEGPLRRFDSFRGEGEGFLTTATGEEDAGHALGEDTEHAVVAAKLRFRVGRLDEFEGVVATTRLGECARLIDEIQDVPGIALPQASELFGAKVLERAVRRVVDEVQRGGQAPRGVPPSVFVPRESMGSPQVPKHHNLHHAREPVKKPQKSETSSYIWSFGPWSGRQTITTDGLQYSSHRTTTLSTTTDGRHTSFVLPTLSRL